MIDTLDFDVWAVEFDAVKWTCAVFWLDLM